MAGQMTLDDVIDYCAAHNIDGVDFTGYYFPGYPKVPADEYLYNLKKKAYLNGVSISGTGVRNDFTSSDPASPEGADPVGERLGRCGQKLGAVLYARFFRAGIPERLHLREGSADDDPCVSGVCGVREEAWRDHRACSTMTTS